MAKDSIINPPTDVSKQVHDIMQRAAYVEERYKTFEGRLRQLQKNVVEHHQELRRLIRDIDKQIVGLKGQVDGITDRMKTFRSEILLRATKEDLAVLQKYVDVWNPFQFVTADQVEDIVREVLSERRKQS